MPTNEVSAGALVVETKVDPKGLRVGVDQAKKIVGENPPKIQIDFDETIVRKRMERIKRAIENRSLTIEARERLGLPGEKPTGSARAVSNLGLGDFIGAAQGGLGALLGGGATAITMARMVGEAIQADRAVSDLRARRLGQVDLSSPIDFSRNSFIDTQLSHQAWADQMGSIATGRKILTGWMAGGDLTRDAEVKSKDAEVAIASYKQAAKAVAEAPGKMAELLGDEVGAARAKADLELQALKNNAERASKRRPSYEAEEERALAAGRDYLGISTRRVAIRERAGELGLEARRIASELQADLTKAPELQAARGTLATTLAGFAREQANIGEPQRQALVSAQLADLQAMRAQYSFRGGALVSGTVNPLTDMIGDPMGITGRAQARAALMKEIDQGMQAVKSGRATGIPLLDNPDSQTSRLEALLERIANSIERGNQAGGTLH